MSCLSSSSSNGTAGLSVGNGRTIGHRGASDQLLGLNHVLDAGELKPGDHMLLIGTAPGIHVSCAMVEVLKTPSWPATS